MVGVLFFSLVGGYERPSVADMRAETFVFMGSFRGKDT